MLTFAHPIALVLLAIPLLAGWWAMRQSPVAPRRSRAVVALALLGLTAAILALASPLVKLARGRTVEIAVIELSPSISADGAERVLERIRSAGDGGDARTPDRVVAFANRAIEVHDDRARPPAEVLAEWREQVTAAAGDAFASVALADAVQLAGELVRPGERGVVTLWATGVETRGDALSEAAILIERGIAIRSVPLTPVNGAPLVVGSAKVPAHAAKGQTVRLNLTLRVPASTDASVEVAVAGETVANPGPIQLSAGDNAFPIDLTMARPGLNVIDIAVTCGGVTQRAAASSWVEAARRVVVIEAGGGRTADALSRILGPAATVSVVAPGSVASGDAIAAAELIVVGDLPATELDAAAVERVRQRVQAGVGLLFTGGARSFGAGGWADSPLASLMPVKMPQELAQSDPSASVVFIIDTSGSMAGTRLELAKEVVRLALRNLEPQDRAGIVEFYGAKRWAAPLQPAANRLGLNRALNRLTSGGGTEIFPAVEEASYALRNVNTRTRHVIIVTDGGVETAPFEPLIRRMAEENQTVSTIAIGTDESPLMESMAAWGRGRFYRVTGRLGIPEILLHRPQSDAPPPVVERSMQVRPREADAVTRALDFSGNVELGGYVRVAAKPAADVLLESEAGDPLMVRWQVGPGRVAALPTSLGSAWTDAASRSALSPAIANLCRSLYATGQQPLVIETSVRPAGVEVEIRAAVADTVQPLNVVLRQGESTIRNFRVDPILAGRWRATMTDLPPGTYHVSARSDDGLEGNAAVTVPTAQAQQRYDPNAPFFQSLAAVAFRVGSNPPVNEQGYVALSGPLALLAMVALLLNVYVRRRPRRRAPPNSPGVVAATLVLVFALSDPQSARAAAPTSAASPPVTRPATTPAVDEFESILAGIKATAASETADHAAMAALAAAQELEGDLRGSVESLQRAIALAPDAASRQALQMRLAVLLADTGDFATAADALPASAAGRTARMLMAAIYGRAELTDAAVTAAASVPATTLPAAAQFEHLLRGSLLLERGAPDEALREFGAAVPLASDPRDARFATERLLAAARAAGKLSAAVDDMLSQEDLKADRFQLLAPILREQGRIDDLLALARRARAGAGDAGQQAAERLLAEVVGGAEEAGRLADAEAVCRAAYAANPSSPAALSGLAGVLLRQERTADADAVIASAATRAPSAAAALATARVAMAAGRDEAAVAAALQADRFGNDGRLRARLLLAPLEHGRGNAAVAAQHIDVAAELAGNDPVQLQALGDVCEQIGDPARAISLYQRIKSPAEEAQQRLAWLLTERGDLAAAQAIWRELSQSASSLSRRGDARARMLALAARTGTIGGMASDLEDRLVQGTIDAGGVSLLVQIYAGIRDYTSAADVIRRGRDIIGGEAEMLRQLSQLYLTGNQFGHADRALRRLLEKDPGRAVDTLQQIAVLAIERGRPLEARAALEQIARQTGSDASTDELQAGIFNQLGLYAEAAEAYGRVLKAQPRQAEAWLLWANAMKGAGLQQQAIQRLLMLALQAENDDLFAVAVDALLNLEAPREALRIARRAAVARLCSEGRKFLLYDLVRELSGAMNDVATSTRVAEVSLLFAADQRTDLLRELIQLANAAGRTDRSLSYQRTLLAMGDQVPPQVFLDIGMRLLTDGRLDEASRAFRRAEEVADDDNTRQQVSALYERAGQLKMALRTLEPLVRLHASNIELRARVASLHEQLGEWGPAITNYGEAIRSLLRQGNIAPGLAPAMSFDAGVSKSVTDAERYMDSLIRGILNAARSTSDQAQVAQLMRSIADSYATSSGEGPAVEPAASDVARLVRRIVFPLHRPEIADQLDRKLAAAHPGDAAFRQIAIAERVEWGLSDSANTLATDWAMTSPGNSDPRAASIAPAPSPDEAAKVLPRLLMRGELDRARTISDAAPVVRAVDAAAYPTLIAVARALDDRRRAWPWCELWLSDVIADAGRSADSLPQKVGQVIRSSWPALDDDARAQLLLRVRKLAATAQATSRPELAMLTVQMSIALGEESSMPADEVLQAAALRGIRPEGLAALLQAAPEGQRPGVLEQVLRPLPAHQRRALLLQFSAMNEGPIDPATADVVERLMPAKVPSRDDAEKPFGYAAPPRRAVEPALWRAIGTALVGRDEAGRTADEVVLAAHAMRLAGNVEEGDRLASAAITRLVSDRRPPNAAELKQAVSPLTPPGAKRLLESTREAGAARASLANVFLSAALLDQLGRRDEALALVREKFLHDPAEPTVRAELVVRLREQLRWWEMIELFRPYMSDRGIVDDSVRSNLATARREAGWTPEADTTVFQLYAGRTSDSGTRSERELKRFRAFHQLLRERRQYVVYPARAPVRVGGLQEYDRTSEGQSVYQALANEPWAVADYLSVLRGVPPGAPETNGIAAGIAMASEAQRADVATVLEIAAKEGTLTRSDRALLLALVRGGWQPSAVLAAELERTLLETPVTDLRQIAELGAALEESEPGQAALSWVRAASPVLGSGGEYPETMALAAREVLDSLPPGVAVDDSEHSKQLARLAQRDPQGAHRVIDDLRRRGLIRSATHPRLALIRSQLTAETASAREQLEAALDAWLTRTFQRVPDLTLAMPTEANVERRAERFELIRDVLLQRVKQVPSDAPDLARAASLLGRWAWRHEMPEAARASLQLVHELAPEPGEHWLWAADLARVMGDPSEADAIELRLLRAKVLPAIRFTALLTSLRTTHIDEVAAAEALTAAQIGSVAAATRPATAPAAPSTAPAAR